MSKIIYKLELIIVTVLLFNACSKKECTMTDLGTFNFTQAEINVVPYDGNEILLFIDSLGNSMTCYGSGRGISELEQLDVVNSVQNSAGTQACGYYFYTGYSSAFYQGINDNFSLSIGQYMNQGNPFGQNIKKYIKIQISYTDTKTWAFNGIYNFDSSKLYVTSDTTKSVLFFKNNLKLSNSNNYSSVYELTQINTITDADFIQTVFYTFNQGIVAFKTNTGRSWYFSK